MTDTPSNKPAWVQLYEARRAVGNITTRSPGRPPAPVPRRKVGLTLSQGEITELDGWQDKFSRLLGRKVSMGETVGILTRLCSARLHLMSTNGEPDSLEHMVELMIGGI